MVEDIINPRLDRHIERAREMAVLVRGIPYIY